MRRAACAFFWMALGSWAQPAIAQNVVVEPPPPPPQAPPPPPAAPPPPPGPPPSTTPPSEEREAENALYVEALGAALFYSVNYERLFGDFSLRAGIGAFATNGSTWLGIPVMVNFLGIGSKKHIFEVGAGVSIQYLNDSSGVLGFNSSPGTPQVLGVATLGYRLQPPKGGFMFRAGVAPLFGAGAFIPWPYLAIGASFR
jgi:hypothetical protein